MISDSTANTGRAQIDVGRLIDGAKLGPLQLGVILICFLTAVVDGLDNQAIGFAAPAISAATGIPLASFGLVFSAGLIGGLVGAMVMGLVADIIGRKVALLLCTIIFGVFTLATAYATGSFELVLARLCAGFGLGGAMPCFLTLVSEYAPKARRGLIMAILWMGYPAGGMVGGAIGSYMIPAYGWQSIFFMGGALAVAVGLIQWLLLSESLQFLVLKKAQPERIARLVRQIDPTLDLAHAEFVVAATPKPAKLPLVDLFTQGRASVTLMLWTVTFCTFMGTSFFVLWSPGLMRESGIPIAQVALIIAVLNFASLPSQFASGYLIDRVGPFKLLPWGYLMLGASTAMLALSLGATLQTTIAMGLIGFFIGPGTVGAVYLSTRLYPPYIRSTGSGWATGIGRSGQVFGSLVIGALVGAGVEPRLIVFGMCAVPLIAAVAVLLLSRRTAQDTL